MVSWQLIDLNLTGNEDLRHLSVLSRRWPNLQFWSWVWYKLAAFR